MKNPICCICGEECENRYGNNPWPLVTDEGARCCNQCNDAVIYFRLVQSTLSKDTAENIKSSLLREIKSNNGDVSRSLDAVAKLINGGE